MDLSALAGARGALKKTETKETTMLDIVGGNTGNLVVASEVTSKSADVEQRVLILGKYMFNIQNWIAKTATKVLFTRSEVAADLPPALAAHYAHIEGFDDFETSGLVDLRAFQLHGEHRFTHVIALAEEDLIRAARIRAALGIAHGQDVDAALRFRDKVLMKDVAKAAGVAVPTYAPVEAAIDVVAFLGTHGYPAVVKPRRGHSSIGTAILRTPDDLEAWIRDGFSQQCADAPLDLEIESFVNGTFYHIDGIVLDGDIKLVWPSEYLRTVAEFRENEYIAAVSLMPDNPLVPRIQQFVVDTLRALETPGSSYTFHAEAWHTPDDTFVLCEVASRTGGGEIAPEILELFEIKLNCTYAQAQCQNPITNPRLEEGSPNWEERVPVADGAVGWVFIYPLTGRLVGLPSDCTEPWCVSYTAYGDEGQTYEGAADCADALVSFLVRGDDEADCKARIDDAYAWFLAESQWESV